MKRKIVTTADGSKTIQIEEWNEQYHSLHGAIQESYYVFVKQGLHFYSRHVSKPQENISILEIGFGTGLNAFITCFETEKSNHKVDYVGVEAYPISSEEVNALNYPQLISEQHSGIFNKMHSTSWEVIHQISSHFCLTKRKQFFHEITDKNKFNLIYFDAFGARVQPELWTESIFKTMYDALKNEGVLVTYSAKGSVKRAMKSVGFTIERLEGPPGKRHMLRATKRNANKA